MKPPIFFTTGAVEAILRDAGKTLMQLPHTGPRPVLRLSVALCSLVAFEEGVKSRLQLPAPKSASISEMDRVYGWLSYIPQDKYVLRRIVGARSLIDSVTGRHVYSWRAIGRILGADHKAVQRWHAQGIRIIADKLNELKAAGKIQVCVPIA